MDNVKAKQKIKQLLLDFLQKTIETDWDNNPNLIFARHLKKQLYKQAENLKWMMPDSIETTVNTVLGNINIDFSILGTECSEEDNKYLLELATLTAKCIWKMYVKISDDLGYDVFIKLVQKIELKMIPTS